MSKEKTMKNIIVFLIICLLGSGMLWGQVKDYEAEPYPALNQPASERAAGFIALFENSEVGNMQVYAWEGEELPSDYYFIGRKIPKNYYDFFGTEYQSLLKKQGAAAYATHSIRGSEAEYYLVRMPTNKGTHTITLFRLVGERLEPIKTLAYAFCLNGTCYQQDAFITDLNRDTDLDILIKHRQTPEGHSDITLNEYHRAFLQSDGGQFPLARRGSLEELDVDMYNMKEMW